MKRKQLFIAVPLAMAGMVLLMFVGAEVVRLLWNWLLPLLFGWRTLTFWQAFGILLLCRLLFGSHGWRGGHRFGRERIRERMRERWQHMTPEQRERMRERWGKTCGFEPPENQTVPRES